MPARAYPALPATVRWVGPWSEAERAQVITCLTPQIPALTMPWTLTYACDEIDPGSSMITVHARRGSAIIHAYSATVERDGAAQPVISRCWDLQMFLRQLTAHIQAQGNGEAVPVQPQPMHRAPLEVGRWYIKRAFEKHYQTSRWLNVVIIDGGDRRVRFRPWNIQELLRQHKDAYFQFAWNDQPHQREQKIMVKGRRSSERFTTLPVTDQPYTTVRLRICYALTPEQDTEIILHDGYGLPEIDRWWETAKGCVIALPLPAEAQATIQHAAA